MPQQVRFCTSADGARIAYAADGSGPPIVRAAFYLNHLELDWQCPVWKPYLEELSRDHTLIRHDMRGFGLSDHEVDEFSLDAWVQDLEAVVDAAGVEKFPLMGMCHGGAIAIEYAVRHPERVSQLILFGAYARGAHRRDLTAREREEHEVRLKMVELGWGCDNEAYQQVWPTLFQPRSTLERLRALADLQKKSATGEAAVRLHRMTSQLDVTESCRQVRCPTLVFHPKEDRAAPFEEGRLIAALIPGARLVPLDSPNHVLTEEEPAWADFVAELRKFVPGEARASASIGGLTEREADILHRIAQGLDNAQIAAHLELAEKTVRNHITRIFDKLGVENRGQAIVRAREAGFGKP